MKREAIVAYSFGGSVDRPGPSNIAFGNIINRLVDETQSQKYTVVVQDFIQFCVNEKPDLVVGDGEYISTQRITSEFEIFLEEEGISNVLLIAHPFLHFVQCKRLLEKRGFAVQRVKTGWIPFDPDCENWWVRGPLHLLLYALLQIAFGRQDR